MNRATGFSLRTPASDGACLRDGPRGARHWGASSRHKLVSGRSVWILTMMQSCASAAKLRAAGPFSCMGLFLSSGCFGFFCQFFVRSGKGRSSSRRLRSGSRSARKGVKGPKR